MSDFLTALDAFYRGDAADLEQLLRAQPGLLTARAPGDQGHYCGYFHQATLLHHVAGNPTLRPLPPTTVALTRLLLDLGAEVDAATRPGPTQPDDPGWSTLGLVATSADARAAGHQRPLLELLHGRGANLDFRQGGPLVGALYYGEVEAAAWLAEHDARVDLVAAAGLGALDRMEAFVAPDGSLTPDAHSLLHYSQVRTRPGSREELLGLALLFAARAGQRRAVEWLLGRGAPVSARPPFDHRATPLHWAALHGHAEVAERLLAAGADPQLRDSTFSATPRGWAEHAGHRALAALLPPD